MSSRNTYVTSFIYWPAAIEIVETILAPIHGIDVNFCGNRNHAGYFYGRIDTIGSPPLIVEDIIGKIDQSFSDIGYKVYFDFVIVCDTPGITLHRKDPYGIELWEHGEVY